MVSTRRHPQEFPLKESDEVTPQTPLRGDLSSATLQNTSQQRNNSQNTWSHTPSLLTLVWLAISLPLVMWDTGYVFLRPHSMPGGKYQKPLWVPYELYGQVDHIYGWPAYESGNGFTGAQSAVNVVECVGYFYYLYLVYAHGRTERNVQGTGAPDQEKVGKLAQSRTVYGMHGAKAVVLLYGVALMTLSKTVLYCMSLRVLNAYRN